MWLLWHTSFILIWLLKRWMMLWYMGFKIYYHKESCLDVGYGQFIFVDHGLPLCMKFSATAIPQVVLKHGWHIKSLSLSNHYGWHQLTIVNSHKHLETKITTDKRVALQSTKSTKMVTNQLVFNAKCLYKSNL